MTQTTATEKKVKTPPSREEKEELVSEEIEISKWQAFRERIFLSPEGIIMMTTAFLVDLGELFIPLEPIDPLDIFALVFFSSWMIFRAMLKGKSPEIRVSKKAAATLQKAAKWAKRLKWLRPLLFILEMVPLVGAAPCWMIAVYLELKYG